MTAAKNDDRSTETFRELIEKAKNAQAYIQFSNTSDAVLATKRQCYTELMKAISAAEAALPALAESFDTAESLAAEHAAQLAEDIRAVDADRIESAHRAMQDHRKQPSP